MVDSHEKSQNKLATSAATGTSTAAARQVASWFSAGRCGSSVANGEVVTGGAAFCTLGYYRNWRRSANLNQIVWLEIIGNKIAGQVSHQIILPKRD